MSSSSSESSNDPIALDQLTDYFAGPRHHIVLSPHYDDMALSIGATMAALADAGCDVTDLIVFGAEPTDVELHAFARHHHEVWGLSTNEVIAARRAEEAAAVRLLGASTANLDFHDAIYRSDYYQSDAALFGTPSPEEADVPNRIAAAADAVVRTLTGSSASDAPVDDVRFYAPLAIGNHVDHQLAFQAANVLEGKGYDVWLYEDLPYSMIGDNREVRLASLARQRLGVHIAALSQTESGWRRKIDAVLAYPSQLETVFRNYAGVEPTAAGIDAALSAYHRSIGTETGVERFWAFNRTS